jgi:hypothetical protein
VNVERILSLLPEELLNELAIETEVNRYSKKLRGQVIFKLLIHCILSHKENSLRSMESAYESIGFSLLNAGKKKQPVKYNSISDRLRTINPDYFEKIYHACIETYGNVLRNNSREVIRFDSTIVTLSSKLLHSGYLLKGGDAKHVRQVKFTIGLGELPQTVQIYTEQKHTSENAALGKSVLSALPGSRNAIRIFDRGVTSRKIHDALTEKKIPFISRINLKSKFQANGVNRLSAPLETATLVIHSDQWIYLFAEGCIKAQYPIRCIKGIRKADGQEVNFVCNTDDLSAQEVTELYKQRWDIEVFFKFLKQELNFSHLVNRSENGIKVMLYATLIAATLLLVYKNKNKLTGYKIMKQRFVQELEKSLVKNFVELCGGNPKLVDKLLWFNSS